ncbi:hypothetical protein [Luteimonas notoginsengisoli]|uniref:Uncharacterized protein n=1 Tax=Luteimonas notoginsengisoli TaxID=1578200 RepID=A0ABV7UQ98_9GAMM
MSRELLTGHLIFVEELAAEAAPTEDKIDGWAEPGCAGDNARMNA